MVRPRAPAADARGDRDTHGGRWARPALLAALALLAAACTDQAEVRREEMLQLLQWLPGEYNNNVQVQTDIHNDIRPPHDALALHIIPIDAPVMGTHAFYVQETAADDPRRVMVQRVWTFDIGDKGIVQSVATLKEPLRWREANGDHDLLLSMMTQDIETSRGCDVTWKKSGAHFVGANDAKHCRSTSRATSGTVQIESKIEVDATELSLSETATDVAGQLVQGRTDDSYYRFRRKAQ